MSAPLFKHTPARVHGDVAHDASRLRALLFRAALLLPPLLLLLLSASAPRPCVAQEPAAADNAGASKKTADASKRAGAVEDKPAPRRSNVTGSIKGRVLGEGGEPLSGVAINASRRNSGPVFSPPPTTTTDEEGQFALDGLEPNVYSLGATLPGYIVEPDTQPLSSRNRVRLGDSVTLRMLKGGVITGTVTDASGEPLVAANVRVIKVREIEGRAAPVGLASVRDEPTDDRGVYRIYGLSPGVYVVSAGGMPMWSWWPVPFSDNAPTYYLSGTRDTAVEINVRAGQETAGVDIRFRDERGQRVSGTLVVPQGQSGEEMGGFGVELVHAATGTMMGSTWMSGRENERAFSFEGLSDGDYDVRAQQSTRSGQNSSSPPLRVNVKGADVTGLKLTLVPLANLSGTLSIEPLPEAERALGECKDRKNRILPQETTIFARFDTQALPKNQPRPRAFGSETVPDESGAFTARNLEAGRYRVEVRPADEHFYARSVQLPEAASSPPAASTKPGAARTATNTASTNAASTNTASTNAAPANFSPSRDALDLRPGQQLSGVQIRIAEGAASVGGRVVPAEEGAPLPALLRLYLLPAEREQADNLPRFYEAAPSSADGVFLFRNLAPGRYLVVARTIPLDPSDSTPTRPPFWDAAERLKLRREAEAANVTLDLQPCQRVGDFTVRFPAPANK